MRRAEARLSASIISSNSIRCSSTGWQVGCNHENVRAAHVLLDLHVSLAVLEARDLRLAALNPKKRADLVGQRSFAVPQKILNFSSTRARCGLRSGFSSGLIWTFFSVAVARVAIGRSQPIGCSAISLNPAAGSPAR